MTYRVEMRDNSTKKIEGVRFVIDEIGRLLIFKGLGANPDESTTVSEQELAFVANIGEWSTIEVA